MVTGEETKATEKIGDSYEMVIIVSPDVTDEALEPMVENLRQFITGKNGEVTEVNRWGRKKLAYPIKHAMEGSYVLFRFKMNPAVNKELETNLKISEKVLRYLLIKLDQ
jgi:small subunit ribosomal protein S6